MLPLRIITTMTVAGVEIALFLVGRRLYGPLRALLAATIFGVLTTVPTWEGNLALTEVFMVLPMSAAVLVYLARERTPGSGTLRGDLVTYGSIGLLVAIGSLFRQTGGALLLTFIAWLLAVHGLRQRQVIILCAAFALPWAAFSLYFLGRGTFDAYWYGIVGFFFTYIPTGYRLSGTERFFIVLPSLTVLAWYVVRRRRLTEAGFLPFLLLWFTSSLAGALIAGRPYGHYLIQAFPPFALLVAGIKVPSRKEAWPAAVATAVCVLTAFLMFGVYRGVYHIYRANSHLYYWNYVDYLKGDKSERRYNDFFDWHVNRMMLMAEELESLGARGRTAFIWGEYPWLYPLAGLTPVSRFPTSAYAQDTPVHWQEFTAALVGERPEFVVVAGDAKIPFPFLESFLAQHYRSIGWVQGSRIYQINDAGLENGESAPDLVGGHRRLNPPVVIDPGLSAPIP
jgi:4-amino-4-deoxy-L-arabinose transferase-like glycosyltransferase